MKLPLIYMRFTRALENGISHADILPVRGDVRNLDQFALALCVLLYKHMFFNAVMNLVWHVYVIGVVRNFA
jgi:hypothetical protein